MESADPTQRQKTVEWRARNSQAIRPPTELFDQTGIGGDDRAANDITVAVQILRRGVNDDIRPELDRTLQYRGEKGVVDGHERAGTVTSRGNLTEVRNAEQRIARRLDPEKLGL